MMEKHIEFEWNYELPSGKKILLPSLTIDELDMFSSCLAIHIKKMKGENAVQK